MDDLGRYRWLQCSPIFEKSPWKRSRDFMLLPGNKPTRLADTCREGLWFAQFDTTMVGPQLRNRSVAARKGDLQGTTIVTGGYVLSKIILRFFHLVSHTQTKGVGLELLDQRISSFESRQQIAMTTAGYLPLVRCFHFQPTNIWRQKCVSWSQLG